MEIKFLSLKDFLFILPASLVLGAGLAFLSAVEGQSGAWWIGWLGFSALFIVGLIALVIAWRWADAGKTLAWMIGLALLLRLAAGVAVYIALPINGHNTADDKAGYVFTDAHRRDDQAWGLASSGKPLWSAFDKSYYTDQYGGLLAFSAFTYRYLSPDAHRPLLIILLAALTAALGVPFLYKATRLLWDDKLASVTCWLFVLYPESILTGGAQMREPFLLTFIAMSLWGFADWLKHGQSVALPKVSKGRGWLWMAIGFVGMLMVSPAIALATLVIFAVWVYLRGDHKQIPWQALVTPGCDFCPWFVCSFVGIESLSRLWCCISHRRDLRLVPRFGEVGYLSPRTRLGLDSIAVQKNEHQRTIIVCNHLRFITTGSARCVHRADHVDLEDHCYSARSGMVCSFALDDLQSHCGLGHAARTGAPRVALDFRGFMALGFDLLYPRGRRSMG